MNKHSIYYFYLLIAASLWGLNFHLAKVLLTYSSVFVAGFWRYVFGVLVLFLMAFRSIPSWSVLRQHAGGLFLIGFIGLFGFNCLFFIGMSKTSAINASLIAALNPALTLIFSYFMLRTTINQNQVFGIILALFGVALLLLKGNLASFSNLSISEGDGWMLLACIVFALHNVWVKKYGGGLAGNAFTFLTNGICLLGFLLVMPFMGWTDPTSFDTPFWLAAIGMGALGTATAYFLWNISIAKVGAPQAGVFINLVPLSAALLALLFGETIYVYHVYSGLITLMGIFVMQQKVRKPIRGFLLAKKEVHK